MNGSEVLPLSLFRDGAIDLSHRLCLLVLAVHHLPVEIFGAFQIYRHRIQPKFHLGG